MNIPPKVKKN